MAETATSPRYHASTSSSSSAISSKPTTTPAGRPPNRPGSVGQHTASHHHQHFMPSRPLATPYQTLPTARSSSPSYFGFPASTSNSPPHSKHNWSPPSSAVRSTAAASPSFVPLDQNPDFDAFKRQSDEKAFNLGHLKNNFAAPPPPPSSQGALQQRRTSRDSQQQQQQHGRIGSRSSFSSSKEMTPAEIKSQALEPPPNELSRSPKRMLSPGSMTLPEGTRRASPPTSAQHDAPDIRSARRASASSPRFAPPLDSSRGSAITPSIPRAETLPASTQDDTNLMATPQHVINLLESRHEEVLVLDLRVSTQYAESHINGALSLCIPTTLLKRPSFNVQKLADTFKDERQRQKFESWRSCTHIVVYDASSAVMKDAQIPLNTIKKFRSEGYDGTLYIIKGGFSSFAQRFPAYIDASMDANQDVSMSPGVDSDGPEIAPVIGGCPMPKSDKPGGAMPFFGNIRQNMDLIGGVGQMPLQHPAKATESAEADFPEWLQKAADRKDEGSVVSKKFEKIEIREKNRMEAALSGKVSFDTSPQPETAQEDSSSSAQQNGVQIAGLEKGNKNRYNNIWPFEHSRVKLQGVPSHGCDYFNANYIKAKWSNKRYISTQAPIPATFNDFWNVVWQQDVRVIVMLTAEKEGPQVKAHNYWDKKQYGPLHLEFLSEKRASLEPERIRRHQQQHRRGASAAAAAAGKGDLKRSSTFGSNLFTPIEPPSATSSHSDNKFFPSITNTDPSSASSQQQQQQPSSVPHVTVRRFTLSHERHPFAPIREITQLHYPHWPDFGAPAHPAHLLGLVEQTDAVARANQPQSQTQSPSQSQSRVSSGGVVSGAAGVMQGDAPAPPNSRPVLVHCSAGCGRTGTFCTVDSVIDMLKRQRLEKKREESHQSDGNGMDGDVGMQDPNHGAGTGTNDRQLTPMDIDSIGSPAKTTTKNGSVTFGMPSTHSASLSSPSSTRPQVQRQKSGSKTAPTSTPIPTSISTPPQQQQQKEGSAADTAVEASKWVSHDDRDLVEKTVEDFRLQRLSMVQTLRQYVLCYESVMEWLVEEKLAEKEQ